MPLPRLRAPRWFGARSRRQRILIAAAPVLLILLAAQQLALRDLRALEADYIAAREPTACATQELLPYALRSEVDEDEFDQDLEALLEEAAAEVAAARHRFERRGAPLPFPPLRSARAALDGAFRAQARLYDAMLNDPAGSEAEVRTLGLANTRTERRFATVRRWLLVDPPAEWHLRFVCDEEPPFIPPP